MADTSGISLHRRLIAAFDVVRAVRRAWVPLLIVYFAYGALGLPLAFVALPLYGVLQTGTAPDCRASTIAANNIVNSAFQVGGVSTAPGR